jgi:hypothetical protein
MLLWTAASAALAANWIQSALPYAALGDAVNILILLIATTTTQKNYRYQIQNRFFSKHDHLQSMSSSTLFLLRTLANQEVNQETTSAKCKLALKTAHF